MGRTSKLQEDHFNSSMNIPKARAIPKTSKTDVDVFAKSTAKFAQQVEKRRKEMEEKRKKEEEKQKEDQ